MTLGDDVSCAASTYAIQNGSDGGMLSIRYEPLLGGEGFGHVGPEGEGQMYLSLMGVDYPPVPLPQLGVPSSWVFQRGDHRIPDLLFGGVISAEGRNHNLALKLPERVDQAFPRIQRGRPDPC